MQTRYDDLVNIARKNNDINLVSLLEKQSDAVKNNINQSTKHPVILYAEMVNASSQFELSANLNKFNIRSEPDDIKKIMVKIHFDRLFGEATVEAWEKIKEADLDKIINMIKLLAEDYDLGSKSIDTIFADSNSKYYSAIFKNDAETKKIISEASIDTIHLDNVQLKEYRHFRDIVVLKYPALHETLKKQHVETKKIIDERLDNNAELFFEKLQVDFFNAKDQKSLRNILEDYLIVPSDSDLINLMAEIHYNKLLENADNNLKELLKNTRSHLVKHFANNKFTETQIKDFLSNRASLDILNISNDDKDILAQAYATTSPAVFKKIDDKLITDALNDEFKNIVILEQQNSEFFKVMKDVTDPAINAKIGLYDIEDRLKKAVTNKEIVFKGNPNEESKKNKILSLARHIHARKQFFQMAANTGNFFQFDIYLDENNLRLKKQLSQDGMHHHANVIEMMGRIKAARESSKGDNNVLKQNLNAELNQNLPLNITDEELNYLSGITQVLQIKSESKPEVSKKKPSFSISSEKFEKMKSKTIETFTSKSTSKSPSPSTTPTTSTTSTTSTSTTSTTSPKLSTSPSISLTRDANLRALFAKNGKFENVILSDDLKGNLESLKDYSLDRINQKLEVKKAEITIPKPTLGTTGITLNNIAVNIYAVVQYDKLLELAKTQKLQPEYINIIRDNASKVISGLALDTKNHYAANNQHLINKINNLQNAANPEKLDQAFADINIRVDNIEVLFNRTRKISTDTTANQARLLNQALRLEAAAVENKKYKALISLLEAEQTLIITRFSKFEKTTLDSMSPKNMIGDIVRAKDIGSMKTALEKIIGRSYIDDHSEQMQAIFDEIVPPVKKAEEKKIEVESIKYVPTEEDIELHQELLADIRNKDVKTVIENSGIILRDKDSFLFEDNIAKFLDSQFRDKSSPKTFKIQPADIQQALILDDRAGLIHLPNKSRTPGKLDKNKNQIIDYDHASNQKIASSIYKSIEPDVNVITEAASRPLNNYSLLLNKFEKTSEAYSLIKANQLGITGALAKMSSPKIDAIHKAIVDATTSKELTPVFEAIGIDFKKLTSPKLNAILKENETRKKSLLSSSSSLSSSYSSGSSESTSEESSSEKSSSIFDPLINTFKGMFSGSDTESDTDSHTSKSEEEDFLLSTGKKSPPKTAKPKKIIISDTDSDASTSDDESEVEETPLLRKITTTKITKSFASRNLTHEESKLLAEEVIALDKFMQKNDFGKTILKSPSFSLHVGNISRMLNNQSDHVLYEKVNKNFSNADNYKALKTEIHQLAKESKAFTKEGQSSSFFNELGTKMDKLKKDNEKIIADAESAVGVHNKQEVREKIAENHIKACYAQADKINLIIGNMLADKSANLLKSKIPALEAERNNLLKEAKQLKKMVEHGLVRTSYQPPIEKLNIEDETFEATIHAVLNELAIKASPSVEVNDSHTVVTAEDKFMKTDVLENSSFNIYAPNTYTIEKKDQYNADHLTTAPQLDLAREYTYEVSAAVGKNERGQVTGILNHGDVVKYGSLEDQVIMTLELIREMYNQQGGIDHSQQFGLRSKDNEIRRVFVALWERSISPDGVPYPRLSPKVKTSDVDESFKDAVDAILKQDRLKLMFTGSTEKCLSAREEQEKLQAKLDAQKPWYKIW